MYMDEYRNKIRKEDEEALAAAYAKESELRKQIWNEAIEEAAKEAVSIRLVGVHFVAEQIRKLKK